MYSEKIILAGTHPGVKQTGGLANPDCGNKLKAFDLLSE
jgi:hypothetical protein